MSAAHLFLLRRTPLDGVRSLEVLDAALVAAAFELPTSLLFLDESVRQLQPAQGAGAFGDKTMARQLSVLPEYGIDRVYASAEALAQHGLEAGALALPVTALDARGRQQLIRRHRVVICD